MLPTHSLRFCIKMQLKENRQKSRIFTDPGLGAEAPLSTDGNREFVPVSTRLSLTFFPSFSNVPDLIWKSSIYLEFVLSRAISVGLFEFSK